MIEVLQHAVDFLKAKGVTAPQTGIVLGTGLGGQFVKAIENPITIPYGDIPGFVVSTVESHSGKLLYGTVRGKRVLVMQGRFHFYEGHSLQQITFPIRVMKMLGVQNLLLSNAAGNMNRAWKKGDLMLLDDHINLLPDNPLRGPNDDRQGPRFPDMSAPYSSRLNGMLKAIASARGIILREGVYVSVMGPNLETRAEYRFLQRIGADVVGMSTVPEVIVANHVSLPCCAVSVLTDDCDPDHLQPASLADILRVAAEAEGRLTDLYLELIEQL